MMIEVVVVVMAVVMRVKAKCGNLSVTRCIYIYSI